MKRCRQNLVTCVSGGGRLACLRRALAPKPSVLFFCLRVQRRRRPLIFLFTSELHLNERSIPSLPNVKRRVDGPRGPRGLRGPGGPPPLGVSAEVTEESRLDLSRVDPDQVHGLEKDLDQDRRSKPGSGADRGLLAFIHVWWAWPQRSLRR